jgi:four helix bundle protein
MGQVGPDRQDQPGAGEGAGTTIEGGPAMPNLRHHSLVAWQRSDDLFIKLHHLTIERFPAFERFELGSQLRKAAYSVPANIVEGFAKRYRRERLHFLNIAEGSLAEVGYCLHVAARLGYISDETLAELEAELNRVGAPLAGLVRATQLLSTVTPGIVLLSGVLIGSLLL